MTKLKFFKHCTVLRFLVSNKIYVFFFIFRIWVIDVLQYYVACTRDKQSKNEN